jgi:cell division septum initiation protein DivIVA
MGKNRKPEQIQTELRDAEQRVETLKQELVTATQATPQTTPRLGPPAKKLFGPPNERE